MALTDIKIKAESKKAKGKPFKLYDSGGLSLHFYKKITETKGRVWRYRYKFGCDLFIMFAL